MTKPVTTPIPLVIATVCIGFLADMLPTLASLIVFKYLVGF